METLILVRYGEIALKGHNRPQFEDLLVSNTQEGLKGIQTKVSKRHGRIFVYCHEADLELVKERLKRVFGVVSFSPGVATELNLDAIQEVALNQLKNSVAEGKKTFKVEARRSNKGFPIKSPEICREVGGYLLDNVNDVQVDVHNPDVIVTVEIREQALVFSEVIKGVGGMPYKSAGKAVLLLSGGIDSPVAGYLMARRGVEIEGVHFHSYPFTSERALEKVLDLGRKLTAYTRRIKIYSINLLNIQRAIQEKCPSDEMTILSRRFMMQIAERVAKEKNCKALITGESIGQVASQTMEGLTVTDGAVSMPVFRPLIALDKVEIIDIAHKIDTFETSIQPFEDCCTVFLPDRVVTKPRLDVIEASQSLLDSETLINEAMEGITYYELNYEEC